MAAIIIVGSVALAVAYALLWWLKPDLRRRIEAPGQRFAAAARRYDSVCSAARRGEPAPAARDAARPTVVGPETESIP